MNRIVALLALALVLGESGCFADRTPPDGLPCAVESDCPSTQTCRAALGTCVDVAGLDAEPPALTDVAITPAAATFSQEIRVTFTTEPLLEPPVLTSDSDDLSFTLLGNDGDTWSFTALVAADASDAGAHEISADLIDASGVGAHVTVGSVTIDLVSPDLADCSFDPVTISISNDADLTVDIELVFFDEATVLDLELVGPTEAYFLDFEVSRGNGETFVLAEYVKTGSEVPGAHTLYYVVRDNVGNVANAIGCEMQITP